MKVILSGRIFAGACFFAACAASGVARAADVHIGVNLGVPAPVYVAPTPVYAPPPPPVVYAPPPPPVYAQPGIVIGWHGNRYWDGRRYWNRNDYYRYHGHDRGPHYGPPPGPPPGHGYGGGYHGRH